MSVQVKRRRDTAANIAGFTPAQGELIVDTTNNRVIVGDGATVGGWAAPKLAGDAFTGPVAAPNLNNTYGLPSVASPAEWVHLGKFTAANSGMDLAIKIVDSNGFNAAPAQQRETYFRFLTSNGISVDANGFAGWGSFYSANTDTISPSVVVVANSPGVSATAFDIYYYSGSSYTGSGAFYTVESANNPAGWTHIGTASTTSPGATGSSTVQIAINTYEIQSPAIFNNSLSVNGALTVTSNLTQVAQGANGAAIQFQVIEQTVTLSGVSTMASVPIPANCIVFAVGTRVLTAVTGAPSFGVGVSGNATQFGGALNIALGSTNYGIIGPTGIYAATNLIVTATSGSFTGGQLRLSMKIMLVPPSNS